MGWGAQTELPAGGGGGGYRGGGVLDKGNSGIYRVPTAQGKQGKWQKKIPVRENTGIIEILPKHRENTGNLVCLSCKFLDSKGKRYFDICR